MLIVLRPADIWKKKFDISPSSVSVTGAARRVPRASSPVIKPREG